MQEIIDRLNNGEMKELFHSFNINCLISSYVTNSVSDTKATLICLKPFTNKCLTCDEDLELTFSQNIEIYTLNSIIQGGLYHSSCIKCHQKCYPNFYKQLNTRKKLVTPKSIYNQDFICLGGKKVYSTELLVQFTSSFLRQYSGFENFQNSYNLTITKYCNSLYNQHAINQHSSNNEVYNIVLV